MQGTYYKHWYTPVLIYLLCYDIIAVIQKDFKKGIATTIGIVIGIIVINFVIYLITHIKQAHDKRKYRASIAIKQMKITITMELPEDEIREAKHFFRNDFVNMITKDEHKTVKHVDFETKDTNKKIYIPSTESED